MKNLNVSMAKYKAGLAAFYRYYCIENKETNVVEKRKKKKKEG